MCYLMFVIDFALFVALIFYSASLLTRDEFPAAAIVWGVAARTAFRLPFTTFGSGRWYSSID